MKYYSEVAGIKVVDVLQPNKKPVVRTKTGRDYIAPDATTYKSFKK